MASLHITELAGLPAGDNNTDVLAVAVGAINTAYTLALAASPGNSSAPFAVTTKWLKLKAGGACAYAIGASGVQAAVGGNFMNAGDTEYVRVVPGLGQEINVVTDTA